MSGFGGFGGFGQQNNQQQQQQQNTGFGGFGQTASSNTGFGASSTGSGFGSAQNNTNVFGGNAGGFGSSGGFGATQNTGFGAAKPFGSTGTTGNSLFGTSTTTPAPSTGFGGFGATNANTSSGFGGSTGGLFSASKPATTGFGATSTPNPFGGTSGATTGFGAGAAGGGFGAAGASQECQGTGAVAFQPLVEKEPNVSGNQQVKFENICFQQPYVKFSQEELRLADYAQGRRHANAGGQAGAFGAPTGFGGFGGATSTPATGFGASTANTGTSLFGHTNTAANAFGQAPASTGFGSTPASGGGLFGPQKPATGGLFSNTQQSGFGATQSTGGFGATNTGTTGFGATPATSAPSLFSSTPNKPSLFGAPASTTSFGGAAGTGGFGTPASNPFGQTSTPAATNPFGTTQAQPAAATSSFGGFGNTQQNAASTSLFGNTPKPATTGAGLFNQQQPAGQSSLFGVSATPATTGFGTPQAATNTGGLFGGPKPATAGTTGMFGQPTAAATPSTGGGLFSGFGQAQNQPAQTTGGGLFGNPSQTKSLFGTPQPAQTGGGLFGHPTQQSTGGLFGTGNQTNQQQQPQQPQQGSSLFGDSTLFSGSQQNQQQQQQQGQLTTSINDPAAFGAGSMFSNLATPDLTNPGPLATPLSSLSKQKKAGIIPLYKLSPSSGSRLNTPQKRGGFGFTYSTYGTPNSASSVTSTPGAFGNSLLGAGLGQNKLMKSMSTSSLRNSFNQDSILTPGAFSVSPSTRFNSTGSMKRLVIDRSIRGDFFSPPSKEPKDQQQNGILKKRVSFESNNGGKNNNRPGSSSASSPLKQVETNDGPTPSAEEMGFLRSSRTTNGTGPKTNGKISEPEMEQVKGNELAIVLEEDSPAAREKSFPLTIQPDQVPGEYWMRPSRQEIEAMNRTQRQKVSNFKVGRHGVATVNFDAPVDLSSIDLDTIFGTIVDLQIRAATVYPPGFQNKPPMGQGLNVPSTIQMENSWPRLDMTRYSPEQIAFQMNKHMKRLKRVDDADFKSYDRNTGVWTFTVPHFTTYGLDYDDDESDMGDTTQDEFGQSTLSAPPDTPTPQTRTPRAVQNEQSYESAFESSMVTESDPEDTFDFKKRKVFPGAFDPSDAIEDDDEMEDDFNNQDRQSFLDERSVGSLSDDDVAEPMDDDVSYQDNELVRIASNDMAGSYPQPDATAEHESDYAEDSFEEERMGETPGGLMRARLRESRAAESPLKRKLELNDDNWMGMLEQTISPQKQDREHLKQIRDMETDALLFGSPQKKLFSPVKSRVVSDGRGFATSIDLMHSLFGETKSPAKPAPKAPKAAPVPAKGTGFEWPYQKKSKSNNLNEDDMDEIDQQFHNSVKPSWGPTGTLVYAAYPVGNQDSNAIEMHSLLSQTTILTSEDKDIRFAKFSDESTPNSLSIQKKLAHVEQVRGIPHARLSLPFKFIDFVREKDSRHPEAVHENLVWELASILFDEIEIPDDLKGFPGAFKFLRKDNLSAFWEKVVEQASTRQVTMAKTSEEKAIAALSGHRIPDACNHLLAGKDYHLATLVALLDGNESMRKNIREQLNEWNKARVLSEINQPLRAIYEILAGNVCVCDGIKGAPIEDRIDSFIMSKRFGLDWRQAFGLRLWYAISRTDEIERAVEKFTEDLQQDKESSKPFAWYVEQNISPLWDDQHLEEREDLLWGLLKLYADSKTDLQAILRPENSQLSPLNMRFSWQLSQALVASGKCSYGEQADQKADELTLAFAAQLTNDGHWLDAVFVLLHLSSPAARTKSIQDHLAHHAGRIGAEDGPAFTTLVDEFKIVPSWIWEAKALYMRAVVKDPKREVECLIRAGSFEEAHRTFFKVVAPTAVIEQDDATLRKLLSGFQHREGGIRDWHLGGATYADYLALLDGEKQGGHDEKAVERLLNSLPAMLADARSVGFLEKVAVQEIGACVARVVVQLGKNGKGRDQGRVLRLPLTEDKYLKHTADLSLEYYRGVLAGAR